MKKEKVGMLGVLGTASRLNCMKRSDRWTRGDEGFSMASIRASKAGQAEESLGVRVKYLGFS